MGATTAKARSFALAPRLATLPAATLDNMQAARDIGAAVVLGTTGHSQAQEDVILGFAEAVPMIWAANYSLGVNLLLNLV